MKKINTKKLVLTSILAALSLILYIVGPKFPLPIFPSFLEINFSMLPIFIALFVLGGRYALLVVLVRFLLKMPFTSTAYVGEIADLIISLTIILLSALSLLIFRRKKYKKEISLVLSILFWVIGGILSNIFSLPLYIKMFGGVDVIVGAMTMIPGVTSENYFIKYIFYAVIPFNLMISFVVILITYFVSKRIKFIEE